jgi:hypothetical protein
MNLNIIKILGFLIGLFLALLLIYYANIQIKKIENFDVKTPSNYDSIPVTGVVSTNISSSLINDVSIIPYKKFKYMCINTFYNSNKITNSEGRWYETDLPIEKYNEPNQYHYFTYKNLINLKQNTINNNGSYGADINLIELNGPKCYNFANNIESNELTEFTVLLTLKVKSVTSKNNIIFEMTGNTTSINLIKPEYTTSIININFYINDNNNYDVILTIGNDIYKGHIDNIDKNIITNGDFIVIGLTYTKDEIQFILNKQVFKYKNIGTFKITLGSTPIIINKNGTMDAQLFNFIYYKSIIPTDEYLNFNKYNYYYLSGLNRNKCDINVSNETVVKSCDVDKKLNELEEKINKTLADKQNAEIDYTKYIPDIKPFETSFDLNLGDTIKGNIFTSLFKN